MPKLSTTSPAPLDVVYAPAVVEDAVFMRRLRGQNWMQYVSDPQDVEWMAEEVAKYCGRAGVEIEMDRIHLANTEPNSNFYFQTAKIKGQLAGYIAGFREHPDVAGAQEIAALHVAPELVGKGIGSKALECFFKDVGEYKPTVLDVVAGAPAVNFYKSKGFHEWEGHSDLQWGPLCAIRMKKEQA